MAREVSPALLADPDRLLTVSEVAAAVGITDGTWTSYMARGRAPLPDDPDDESGRPANRRMPRWRAATVAEWQRTRRAPNRSTP